MDASGGVPRVLALNILNSVNEVIASGNLTLTKILALSKNVRGHSFLILDNLLHNYSFGELFLISFGMKCLGSTVQDSFLCIAKTVIFCVKLPVIISILLFAWSKVSVSLSVHLSNLLGFSHASVSWIDHVFSILKSFAWETKFVVATLHLCRPVITSFIRFT